MVLAADGGPNHRLHIVDRYRRSTPSTMKPMPHAFPTPMLSRNVRFLATACPECGVIDDPTAGGPTP